MKFKTGDFVVDDENRRIYYINSTDEELKIHAYLFVCTVRSFNEAKRIPPKENWKFSAVVEEVESDQLFSPKRSAKFI